MAVVLKNPGKMAAVIKYQGKMALVLKNPGKIGVVFKMSSLPESEISDGRLGKRYGFVLIVLDCLLKSFRDPWLTKSFL